LHNIPTDLADYKEALYKIIGDRIKSHRESMNISQLQLSKNLDISRSSISNIEVGRHQVPLYTLYDIAKDLKIDVNELLPSYDEVINFATSNVTDYSRFLNSSTLKKEQKEKLNVVLKKP
jgi:transcriptional regulator with XRE-family HTH domain